jgi:hypothetical protein
VFRVAEHAATLGDPHTAKAACPWKDITKQVTMHGAVMRHAKTSNGERFRKALGCGFGLEGVQRLLVAQP